MFAVPAPPVRHQQLLVTIFGLYGRNAGDALPVSALISMLGSLGYDAPGVRSSVSRLKAKGVLKSVREGGIAKYKISESVSDVFREGDRRIFAPEQPAPVDTWVLAVFSVPESMRNRRHQLRSALLGLGFGSVANGVWIAPPAHKLEQARERLTASGLIEFVDLFRSDYVFDGPMRPKISEWWDSRNSISSSPSSSRSTRVLSSNGPSRWAMIRKLPWLRPPKSCDATHSAFTFPCSPCGVSSPIGTRTSPPTTFRPSGTDQRCARPSWQYTVWRHPLQQPTHMRSLLRP